MSVTVAPAMALGVAALSRAVPDKLLVHKDGVCAPTETFAVACVNGVTVAPAVALPSAVTVAVVAAN